MSLLTNPVHRGRRDWTKWDVLKLAHYYNKLAKMQGYIAVGLKYRCRIDRVGLDFETVSKTFSMVIKCKGFKGSRVKTGKAYETPYK